MVDNNVMLVVDLNVNNQGSQFISYQYWYSFKMYKNKMLGCIPNFLGVLPGIDVLLRTIKKNVKKNVV